MVLSYTGNPNGLAIIYERQHTKLTNLGDEKLYNLQHSDFLSACSRHDGVMILKRVYY